VNTTTLIYRLTNAIHILKGMCGDEPDKRDPAMIAAWEKVSVTLDEAEMYLQRSDNDDHTMPCDSCGEDVVPGEHCGNDLPDSSEYLCGDCYIPNRFADMPREDVIAYLHGRGFAVQAFDNETTDELRNAAYLDELEERGNQ
jgi:hypothetical protein